MNDFLLFMDDLVHRFPVHVEVYYSKTMDWCINVWKEGCADDYPDSKRNGDNAIICQVQSSDMELVFAKAQVEVKEWLLNNWGGY